MWLLGFSWNGRSANKLIASSRPTPYVCFPAECFRPFPFDTRFHWRRWRRLFASSEMAPSRGGVCGSSKLESFRSLREGLNLIRGGSATPSWPTSARRHAGYQGGPGFLGSFAWRLRRLVSQDSGPRIRLPVPPRKSGRQRELNCDTNGGRLRLFAVLKCAFRLATFLRRSLSCLLWFHRLVLSSLCPA